MSLKEKICKAVLCIEARDLGEKLRVYLENHASCTMEVLAEGSRLGGMAPASGTVSAARVRVEGDCPRQFQRRENKWVGH